MKRLSYKALFLISIIIGAASCTNQNATAPCDEWNALAVEMKTVMDQIKANYESETLFLKRLGESQVYWLQYKERHMKMLYPEGYDITRRKYGEETFNPCKCKELTRLFKLRVDELKVFRDGPRKGQEECPTFNNI